jgi:hypothetical protein
LANQGAPLWCIEKQIYPLYDGVGDITMTRRHRRHPEQQLPLAPVK